MASLRFQHGHSWTEIDLPERAPSPPCALPLATPVSRPLVRRTPFSRLPSTLRRNDQQCVASYEAGAASQQRRHRAISCGAPCARVPALPTQPNNRTYPESAGDSIVGLVDPVSVEDEVAPRRLKILGQKPGPMQEVGWIRLRVDCTTRGAGTGPSASAPLAGMPQPGPCGS